MFAVLVVGGSGWLAEVVRGAERKLIGIFRCFEQARNVFLDRLLPSRALVVNVGSLAKEVTFGRSLFRSAM